MNRLKKKKNRKERPIYRTVLKRRNKQFSEWCKKEKRKKELFTDQCKKRERDIFIKQY